MLLFPPCYMDKFLTIKQAVEFSGRSKSTIRRLIDEIVKDKTAEARSQILPSAEDVERLRRKSETYTWKVSEDLLRDRFQVQETDKATPPQDREKGTDANINSAIVSILRDDIATLKSQLDRKDEQLREANERMKEANERNREQNVLLRDLQTRIPQLTAARDGGVVDANATTEKGSQATQARRKIFGVF